MGSNESPKKLGFGAKLKNAAALTLATGVGTGYFPLASGTVGSLVGVGIVWLLRDVGVFNQVLICVVLAVAGVLASDIACDLLDGEDPSQVVIDEIVGFMVTMVAIPVSVGSLVGGFLIFRFFDVAKLPPANIIDERLKNAWGVMLDDVVAGIFGNIWLHLILRAQI